MYVFQCFLIHIFRNSIFFENSLTLLSSVSLSIQILRGDGLSLIVEFFTFNIDAPLSVDFSLIPLLCSGSAVLVAFLVIVIAEVIHLAVELVGGVALHRDLGPGVDRVNAWLGPLQAIPFAHPRRRGVRRA